MSRDHRRSTATSGGPSRVYIIFVSVMVGMLVLGSVALIAGAALFGDDQSESNLEPDTRPGEEVSRLETAVAEDPGDTESMAVLANILANSGELDKAIIWYERAVEAAPEDGDLRVAFGLALFQLGNDFDATVQLRRAAELLPDSATPPFYLGQISERGSNPDVEQAREWYERAVEVAPESLVADQAQERLTALDAPEGTPTP